MAIKGGLLRLMMISCYAIAFCCAVIITGAFAWFTATQIGWRNIASLAVGVLALLYTATNVITTCCTAGIGFLAIMSIVMDFSFSVLMISLAVINRSARHGCNGPAPYPRAVERGSGTSGCRLYVAAWAVVIISIFLYIITMATQFVIRRRGGSDRRGRTTKGGSPGYHVRGNN